MTDPIELLEDCLPSLRVAPGRYADAIGARIETAIGLIKKEGWQPIETAPKDRLIDIFIENSKSDGRRWCDCYYDRITDQWRTSSPGGKLVWVPARAVTHWREPASPPAEWKTCEATA